MTTETNGKNPVLIEGPLACRAVTVLTRHPRRRWAKPVRATLLLPACSTLALLCSQVRPDCYDSDITQQVLITNITPSESLIWVLNLWCYFASHHFIRTPNMTNMVWRPSADPESPPYEHPQVSPVQVWPCSDYMHRSPVPHTAGSTNSLLDNACHRSFSYDYCTD